MFILAAAVLWGTTGTAQALAPTGSSPVVVGAVRLAIGALALLAVALWRRGFGGGASWPVGATAVGAAAVAGYQLCFFSAVKATGVAIGTLVAIGSAPVIAGVLGRVLRGEPVTGRWLGATALSIAGCTLLLGVGGQLSADATGIALAVGAGASYALYALVSKQLLESHTPDAVMAVLFGGAAVILAPALLLGDLGWLARAQGVAVALHLGIATTALAYALFARGLVTTAVGTATTLSLAEPLTAAALGVLVLGERISGPSLLGAALVLAGLIWLVLPAPSRSR